MATHKRDLTRAQISNLKKLATYLENLPTTYEHFAMSTWFDGEPADVTRGQEFQYAVANGGVDQFGCGTVACAVGHGPAAGVLFRRGIEAEVEVGEGWSEGEVTYSIDWESYARRFASGRLIEFLFGGAWAEFDDTHRGAAARIRFILAGNEIPNGFSQFLDDTMEACKPLYAPFLVVGDEHIAAKVPA